MSVSPMLGTRAAVLVLIVATAGGAHPAVAQEKGDKKKSAKVRYDGLYLSTKQSNVMSGGYYVTWRFFANGTVLVKSFTDSEKARGVAWMAGQLIPDAPDVTECTYTIVDTRIQMTGPDLDLAYEGTVAGESLKVRWKSTEDGTTRSATANFVPATFTRAEDDPSPRPVPSPVANPTTPAATPRPERTYGWHLSYRSLILYLPVLLIAPALGVAAGRFWGGKTFFNTTGMVYTAFGCIGYIFVAFSWLVFIVLARAAGFEDQEGMAGFLVCVGLPALYSSAVYSQVVLNIGFGFHGTTASLSCGRCHAAISCWKYHLNQPHCPSCGVYFDAVAK